SAECILATNTSSLSVNDIGSALSHPERFCGLHFFNPVPAMRLVELIASTDTSPATMALAAKLVTEWGKEVIIARDVPGFIVNSVARPYY
ncbi:3-hydroxyacyl-CoA dehydrogenase family protein, partial [Escherichia coli]|uniref:3-hydroxyacyl-CoA dehydrogenase family protein n=1 Tax=Escherichia coli TaxID=562 RepID=UPI003CE4B52D